MLSLLFFSRRAFSISDPSVEASVALASDSVGGGEGRRRRRTLGGGDRRRRLMEFGRSFVGLLAITAESLNRGELAAAGRFLQIITLVRGMKRDEAEDERVRPKFSEGRKAKESTVAIEGGRTDESKILPTMTTSTIEMLEERERLVSTIHFERNRFKYSTHMRKRAAPFESPARYVPVPSSSIVPFAAAPPI